MTNSAKAREFDYVKAKRFLLLVKKAKDGLPFGAHMVLNQFEFREWQKLCKLWTGSDDLFEQSINEVERLDIENQRLTLEAASLRNAVILKHKLIEHLESEYTKAVEALKSVRFSICDSCGKCITCETLKELGELTEEV